MVINEDKKSFDMIYSDLLLLFSEIDYDVKRIEFYLVENQKIFGVLESFSYPIINPQTISTRKLYSLLKK
jgi:hypothetical protein